MNPLRFKILVEYDGTDYHGWQLQKSDQTVQGELESVLERILQVHTRVHGAGRTDAGVHAKGQVAHFDAYWQHSPEKLIRALNSLLPENVAVHKIDIVPQNFHSRHSAKTKTYTYTILNSPLRSPLFSRYSWHVPAPLAVSLMNDASQCLVGVHDFAAFGQATDGTPSTEREILSCHWTIDHSSLLKVTIRGTGFLRYMVRTIVGTVTRIGLGKSTLNGLISILESRDKNRSGPTAPARGLCLTEVEYPDLIDTFPNGS